MPGRSTRGLVPGAEIIHRHGWLGVLSHREGRMWSVVWSKSDLSDGWSFSLEYEADLTASEQPKLFEEIPGLDYP